MKYTQSELYYYFKKEMPKKFNPRIEFDSEFEANSFIVDNKKLRFSEKLSNFKFESIKNFLLECDQCYKTGNIGELEKCSYDIIHKLYVLEQNSIPRVLIERNFNSKI